MNLHLLLGLLVFVAVLVLIIWRPRGLPEWATALGGALALLLLRVVSPPQAAQVLYANLNVFGFFLGLMTISAVAESAGFFDWLAGLAARHSGQSSFRLMLNIMLIGVVITTFLSNDATALILTPVVYALVVRLRLEPLPFMFACTFIADTASFTLPVSNPINVLVLTSFPRDLFHYLDHLLLAAVLVIGGNVLFFLWRFRADLTSSFDASLLETFPRPKPDRYFRFVAGSLAIISVAYLVGSSLRWPLSIVALAGAGPLVAGGLSSRRLDLARTRTEISWSIFGFIAGMLVVVRAVENLGVTALLGKALVGISRGTTLGAALASVAGAAVGANAINNVSAATVMISSIQDAVPPGAIRDSMVFGTILGADLGPNITTVGSLATILWLVILRRKGLDISSVDYFRLGITVTPALLLIGAAALWLSTIW